MSKHNKTSSSEDIINLSEEKYNLKKYASFGLVTFSSHAIKRIRERGLNSIDVFRFLTQRNATICQYKEKGSYNNKYPRFVVHSKMNKKNIHIVVEKQIHNGAPYYQVVTVYEPSQKYFSHGGLYVKKAKYRG